MRRASAVAAALAALVVSAASAAPGQPVLRLVAGSTLTVAGTGFPANAAVRVVAAAPRLNVVHVVRASRAGAFRVVLGGAKRSCLTGIVIVASARGIRSVRLEQRPRVCPPPVSPAVQGGAPSG